MPTSARAGGEGSLLPADSSKFGEMSPVQVATQFNVLITEAAAASLAQRRRGERSVRLVSAP